MKLIQKVASYLGIAGVLLGSNVVLSQEQVQTIGGMSEAVPAEVLAAMNSSENVTEIFTVTGNESYAQQVLKADEIVFAEGASLIIEVTDKPWVLIKARTIKFTKPEVYSKIIVKKS